MLKKIAISTLSFSLPLVMFLLLVSALSTPTDLQASDCDTSSTTTDCLPNPLGTTNDPVTVVGYIIRAMLGVLGGITLVMFIYGGFQMIFSQGNEEKLKKGRGTLIWAIIGMAVVMASYSILNYLFQVLNTYKTE